MKTALTVSATLVAGLLALAPATSPAYAAAPPVHTLSVTAPGTTMFPAFSPDIERYAVTSPTVTPSTLTVRAGSSEAGSTVRVNGVPDADGTRTLTGLKAGDEVSVLITDSAGTAVHSVFVAPAGFPVLDRVDTGAPDSAVSPGHVLLTLSDWADGPFYETAVDDNGVPVFARPSVNSMDLKRQPTGDLTVSRRTTTPDRTGSALAVLDDSLDEVSRHETVGLVDTDGHDSILLPDGSHYLLAYEPNAESGLTDSVIQQVSAEGDVLWEWNSADHVDPATESVVDVTTNKDYGHINSIQLMPDGDVLASFRHFSAVFKIARHAREGVAEGDIVWKLGGRDSDFRFVDENGDALSGDGGPCAQHTASVVGDGHIMVFDNGSWSVNNSELCIDPDDPTGPLLARPLTRVTEYALDVEAGTASPVWNYEEAGRFAIFAGSAERLPNGNTLIAWASSRAAVATEVNAAGTKVWELVDPEPDNAAKQFTYRAFRTPVADTSAPQITLRGVADGASYAEGARVTPAYTCTDRGGSSLRSCRVTGLSGTGLDTRTPGRHRLTVTATDGAGRTTTVTRAYTVRKAAVPPALSRPDAAIRVAGGGFRGLGKAGSAKHQTVSKAIRRTRGSTTFVVRVVNRGNRAERFRLVGAGSNRRFKAVYRVGGTVRTSQVTRGRFRTPVLRPGQAVTIRLAVRRLARAHPGARRTFRVRAISTLRPGRHDTVAAVVRAKRRR